MEPQTMQFNLAAAHSENFSMFVRFSLKDTSMHTARQRSSELLFRSRRTDLKKKKVLHWKWTLVPETSNPLFCSYSVITFEMSCDKRHCLSKIMMAGANSNSERGISCITNMATPSGSWRWLHTRLLHTLQWTKCLTPFLVCDHLTLTDKHQ